MSLLASCWLIIETIIIPEGFLKWFYLSFYIHPIFLCLCQFVLWIKLLQEWFFFLILFLHRTILCASVFCISIIVYLKNRVLFLVSSTLAAGSGNRVLDEVVENEIPLVISNQSLYATHTPYFTACEFQIGNLDAQAYYKVDSITEVKEIVGERDTVFSDEDPSLVLPQKSYDFSTGTPSPTSSVDTTEDLSPARSSFSSYAGVELNLDGEDNTLLADAVDMFPPLSCLSGSSLSPVEVDLDINEIPLSLPCPHLHEESELIVTGAEKEVDSVYNKYVERMKWFDVLSQDRVHGIDAILNKHLWRSGSIEGMVPVDLSIHSISWSKKAREKLITSLRSDFELVFVAQSCLSWEALHHQFHKVETIANSASQNGVFHKNIAERFQKFQILLERFIEDDQLESERYSNYVRKRFSLKYLLQVPEVSTHREEGKNDRRNGEAMNLTANQVLKTIKNCVKVFWLFVKAEGKKPTWKIRNILWTDLPVEDPRDLELLHDLRKIVKKKELLLKNLEGKEKCWLKKAVNPLVRMENEKDDFLFSMIDLKLVRKVLQMSIISTCQLQWCQDKLNNVELREGKVYRTHQTYLFPSS